MKTMNKLAPIALLAALFAGACAEEIPDDPTWNGEIEIMLTANCGRCHGETLAPGVPPSMRLDIYEDAFEARFSILARSVNYEEIGVSQMPPDSYLSNEQKEILGIWIENGAPLGPAAE
tara:strand:- start:161427 stop:161783 length:357 start_codon:yes stop_codon:yes gene_type:complete